MENQDPAGSTWPPAGVTAAHQDGLEMFGQPKCPIMKLILRTREKQVPLVIHSPSPGAQ